MPRTDWRLNFDCHAPVSADVKLTHPSEVKLTHLG